MKKLTPKHRLAPAPLNSVAPVAGGTPQSGTPELHGFPGARGWRRAAHRIKLPSATVIPDSVEKGGAEDGAVISKPHVHPGPRRSGAKGTIIMRVTSAIRAGASSSSRARALTARVRFIRGRLSATPGNVRFIAKATAVARGLAAISARGRLTRRTILRCRQ